MNCDKHSDGGELERQRGGLDTIWDFGIRGTSVLLSLLCKMGL